MFYLVCFLFLPRDCSDTKLWKLWVLLRRKNIEFWASLNQRFIFFMNYFGRIETFYMSEVLTKRFLAEFASPEQQLHFEKRASSAPD